MHTPAFVSWFRQAAPYIHAFRGRTFVIAFGGEVITEGHLAGLCHDINLLASLGVRLVLVYGVRPQAEALLAERGMEGYFHSGRRVTDALALVALQQAVGEVRSDIEAQLSMALPNSPMAGADLRIASGNYVMARPLGVLDGVDMQYTGSVRKIDTIAIQRHLDLGEVVLISPLGFSPTGEIFNLPMEELAMNLARHLKAEKLIFLTDTPGIHDQDDALQTELTASEAEALLAVLKRDDKAVWRYLECAVHATRHGVSRAHLVSHSEEGALLTELFTHDGVGTMVSRESLVKVRDATIDDVGAILALIEPLEQRGALVKRGRELLEMEIHHYAVIEHDGMIAGCVAMHLFIEAGMAELACLAVSDQWRDAGYGEELVRHVENRARRAHIQQIFVLTTQTAHWFVERGFVRATTADLPMQKQQLYNYQRRSQVLIKRLH